MDRNKNTETKNSQLDTFQSMLDAAGFVPGYGEPADLLNALISLGRGNKQDAALSALSALPFLGMIGGVKKLKPFKNVKFRKTGPGEKDYIITNRKEVAESVADDFLDMGENLTNKARKQNEELYNSLIDIYDPKQQGRAIVVKYENGLVAFSKLNFLCFSAEYILIRASPIISSLYV